MVEKNEVTAPEGYPPGACIPAHLIKPVEPHTQYVVAPQPFKVTLDSPTDFVAVLLVPIALAIAAGVFTIISSREQMKASTANFRHTWQLDLRNSLVSFIGVAEQMFMRIKTDPSYPNSSEADAIRAQFFTAENTIILMLDTEKQYAKDLKAQMLKVRTAIFETPARADDASLDAFGKVVTLSRTALERAWQDIRRDLRVNRDKSVV